MNWDAIGAVGEIVGAIAVFMSLVYLALQIRIQNRESQLNAIHDITLGFRDSITKYLNDDGVELFLRAEEDYDGLTDSDRTRFLVLASQFFLTWEEAYMQHEIGRLPNRNWQSIQKYYLNGLSPGSMQRAWSLRKSLYDPEFASYVDSQVVGEYVTK